MRWYVAAALACVVGAGGCGRDERTFTSRTMVVRGKVLYQGKPLKQGTIRFEPEDAGRPAYGRIGPDGTYSMTTFEANDGAVPGVHRVAVDAPGLPLKFRSPSSSEVQVDVVPDRAEYEIELN